MRYIIRLSYDGSSFSGWQIQPNATTVQGCLESALSTLLKRPIEVTGAGRTDAKVNAINYIAHFDVPEDCIFDSEKVAYKLNAILPRGTRVHEMVQAKEDFHARFDATERGYRYFVHRKKDPFMESYSYQFTFDVDVEKMNRAAEKLLGTHDFSCFEKLGGNNKTSICTVTEAKWEHWTPSHVSALGYPCGEGDYLVFTIKADRFLRNMVRAVVGTLLDVGRGKKDENWIEELLKSGDRCAAGESVPGNALFLFEIQY
ncbi:MAG: tRNA pseudouridine(38-40) synthase TruA [Bacteroidales bacterium]|nr:tRNA pseudouridine(38-40) synthase TruA [Bacteroidales bacterium]